jgi:hypothetical protein
MKNNLPTRKLRQRPNLDQLKRQAKELLRAFVAHESDAVAEVNTHYRDADETKFALHDAQLVLARSYGFDSWPKLKAYVDGATVKLLVDAVCAGDVNKVRAMLRARPELVHMHMAGNDEPGAGNGKGANGAWRRRSKGNLSSSGRHQRAHYRLRAGL